MAVKGKRGWLAGSWLAALGAQAAGVPGEAVELDEVTVSADSLVGEVDSATIGTVYAEQLERRPMSRQGEVLEVVPGLIVTQHSGEGKANQYFLRGYNLDHGTDFATTIDGLPVNSRTHAHGQGYSDNSFLIPELVDSVEYRKGPYYADYGDFSAAGAADIRYRDRFDRPIVELAGGAYGYGRVLGAGSYAVDGGDLLLALEGVHYDGPFDRNQNFNKGNVVARYAKRSEAGRYHVAFSGYSGKWDSPDQIPLRAVPDIGRLGFIDPSVGGKSHRVNLSAGLERTIGDGLLTVHGYAFRYRLQLFSNFTYFLDDPVNGDQFEQSDRRNVFGGSAKYHWHGQLFGLETKSEIGTQTQYDAIDDVGLYLTRNRQRLETTTESDVGELSYAVHGQTGLRLSDWARVTIGARFDVYDFDVDNNNPLNSGHRRDSLFSPKFALVLGPFAKTEFFFNAGQGFHSNDARGTTQTIDPRSGAAVAPVSPLVPAVGYDLGLRTALIPNVQLAASLFTLSSDSELVYVGDAGTTEPNAGSRRFGGELGLYWKPLPGLLIDGDIAYTRARFRGLQVDDDGNPIGQRVPQAVEGVAALGVSYQSRRGWDAGLRLRHFGPRALLEDNSQRSRSTTVVNLGLGYLLTPRLKVTGEVLNLFDSKDHDIDYFYESRLADEAAPQPGRHFHPIEPINGRVSIRYSL
jgi:outer membrane receptor protein involved in Fe transport